MTRPDLDSFSQAAEWLRANEGPNGEAEACAAVADWLEDYARKAMQREIAREVGAPVAKVRAALNTCPPQTEVKS